MEERRILCERARTWAALQPDGELSTFEQRLLRSHLDRCAECSAFAARVAAVTTAVRAAPLEPLAHPVSMPGMLRRRARRFAPRRVVYPAAAAVAAAAFVLSIGSAVSVSGGEGLTTAAAPILVFVDSNDDRRENLDMRQLRRLQLVSDVEPESSRPRHFGVVAGL
jgi:anti-sigma factor RsiW